MFPASRLGWYSHDSGLKIILTQKSLQDFATTLTHENNKPKDRKIILIEDLMKQEAQEGKKPQILERNDGLSYMIYTSGSTGKVYYIETFLYN